MQISCSQSYKRLGADLSTFVTLLIIHYSAYLPEALPGSNDIICYMTRYTIRSDEQPLIFRMLRLLNLRQAVICNHQTY